jgi:hypothetical protein
LCLVPKRSYINKENISAQLKSVIFRIQFSTHQDECNRIDLIYSHTVETLYDIPQIIIPIKRKMLKYINAHPYVCN